MHRLLIALAASALAAGPAAAQSQTRPAAQPSDKAGAVQHKKHMKRPAVSGWSEPGAHPVDEPSVDGDAPHTKTAPPKKPH